MTVVEKLVIALGLDTKDFQKSLDQTTKQASDAEKTAAQATSEAAQHAGEAVKKSADGAEEAAKKTNALRAQMQGASKEFDSMGEKWAGAIKTFALRIAAPITAAFGIWKGISGYAAQVGQVAQMTGAYSTKLEEWRKKRAMLSRVTREDIQLYRKSRESVVGFQIAMDDLAAKITRNFGPAINFALDILRGITRWISANQDNLARFFTIAAGVITAVFLPAIVRLGAAMMLNPLTWLIATIGLLILVIDDLVTYMQGGRTTLGGFWSLFGTGEELAQKVGGAIQALKGFVKDMLPYLGIALAAFAAFRVGVTVFTLVKNAVLALRAAFLLLAANPLILILTAIAAVAIYLIGVFQRAGGDIGKVFEIIAGDIKARIQDALNFVGNLFGGLVSLIARGFAWILGLFGIDIDPAFMRRLLDACANFPQFVKDSFNRTGEIIRGFIGSIIERVSTTVDRVRSFFASLPGAVIGFFADLASGAAARVSVLIDRIKGFFSGLGSNIRAAFSSAFDAVTAFISAWLSGLPGQFRSAFNIIAQTIKDAFAAAWEWIKSLINPAELLSGIKDKIAGFGSSITDIFTGGDEEEDEEKPQRPAVYDTTKNGAEAVQPYSNGVAAWSQQQLAAPASSLTPTEQIQSAVTNSMIDNRTSTDKSQKTYQQNNNITINTNGSDIDAMTHQLNNTLNRQNDAFQRQTLAVESGVRT